MGGSDGDLVVVAALVLAVDNGESDKRVVDAAGAVGVRNSGPDGALTGGAGFGNWDYQGSPLGASVMSGRSTLGAAQQLLAHAAVVVATHICCYCCCTES